MSETKDNPGVIVHPPIALLIAFVAGLVLEWLRPLPFVPASIPRVWIGVLLFAAGFALLIWAFVSFRKAGTNVQTSEPTTAIVERGPYGFSRNPIYSGMFLALTGLADRLQQPVGAGDAGAVLSGDPLRRGRARGSLSRAQVRQGLSRLQSESASLGVSDRHSGAPAVARRAKAGEPGIA